SFIRTRLECYHHPRLSDVRAPTPIWRRHLWWSAIGASALLADAITETLNRRILAADEEVIGHRSKRNDPVGEVGMGHGGENAGVDATPPARSKVHPAIEASRAITDPDPQLSRAELQQLYDTAPVARGVVDTDLRYVRVNEQLAAINGRTVDQHLGRSIHEMVPQLAPVLEPIYRRVFETGEPALNVEVHGSTAAAADRDFLVSY